MFNLEIELKGEPKQLQKRNDHRLKRFFQKFLKEHQLFFKVNGVF